MDCTLKVYNRGNLSGNFAIFFESERAIKLAEKFKVPCIEGNYILAFNQAQLEKGRTFLENNRLHYSEYILG